MSACGLAPLPADGTAFERFAADVRAGLGGPGRKSLPPMHLYDALGSALFEAITRLPEYGVWRAERRVLERHANDIAACCQADTVIELGSGSATKTRLLLEASLRRHPVSYVAVDVSPSALEGTRATLRDLDGLAVTLVEADYLSGLERALQARGNAGRVLVLFLGSSLGNYAAGEASRWLGAIRRSLRSGDGLLVGVDLDKPARRLLSAYADPLGVTAAFNLNLLARMNRELGADFDPSSFRHVARFDPRTRDVEMHLRSLRAQQVHFARLGLSVVLRAGETIHTESSHKYRTEELDALAAGAGFRPAGHWRDDAWPFLEALYTA
ncbi:L-histidine N(alpha)-methyltransferase [Dokdonella sp.]|uniref:L-histidine N(alpha)-methyltransferase n=1 Tax=Dokdonella sp. TaxID=2291710 RepID=UPI002631C9B3|nr:L-histidine N(alpha)-methyltransferase [Dokdonella sp.]